LLKNSAKESDIGGAPSSSVEVAGSHGLFFGGFGGFFADSGGDPDLFLGGTGTAGKNVCLRPERRASFRPAPDRFSDRRDYMPPASHRKGVY
jgi:hypothetical protein